MRTAFPLERPGGPARGAFGLRGYQWWRVTPDDRLSSFPGHVWKPGTNEAACGLYPRFLRTGWRRLHPTGVPGAFCVCGFRGALRPAPAGSLDRLSPRLHSGRDEMLFGVVAGWGTASVEPREWRARFARPVAVYADPALSRIGPDRLAAIADRYSIPLIGRFDTLVLEWGPGASSAGAAVVPASVPA